MAWLGGRREGGGVVVVGGDINFLTGRITDLSPYKSSEFTEGLIVDPSNNVPSFRWIYNGFNYIRLIRLIGHGLTKDWTIPSDRHQTWLNGTIKLIRLCSIGT